MRRGNTNHPDPIEQALLLSFALDFVGVYQNRLALSVKVYRIRSSNFQIE